jgi:hypothetical protein
MSPVLVVVLVGLVIVAVYAVIDVAADTGVAALAGGFERLAKARRPRAIVVLTSPAAQVYEGLQRAGLLSSPGELQTNVGVPVLIRPCSDGGKECLECRWKGRTDDAVVLRSVSIAVQTVDNEARIVVK